MQVAISHLAQKVQVVIRTDCSHCTDSSVKCANTAEAPWNYKSGRHSALYNTTYHLFISSLYWVQYSVANFKSIPLFFHMAQSKSPTFFLYNVCIHLSALLVAVYVHFLHLSIYSKLVCLFVCLLFFFEEVFKNGELNF